MSRPPASWLVLATLLSAPLAAQRGAVAGTVYDSLAGAPLAGARVSLAGTGLSALTDSTGLFRIAEVAAGEYGLTFQHPRMDAIGWMPDTLRTRVDAGGDTRVELAIPSLLRLGVLGCRGEAGPGTSVAVGRVVDARTGQPVAGARVAVSWGGQAPAGLDPAVASARVRTEAVADAEGHWYACDLPQGAVIVARVDHPGYRLRDESLFFDAPSAAHIEMLLTPGGRGETAFLTGRVVNPANGAAVQGAVVTVEGTRLSAMSNEFGLWELSSVPPGQRTLRVRHAGAEHVLPVRVTAGSVMDLDLRLAPDTYTLAPLTVTARRNLGPLTGFYERRERGFGQYLTRPEIQRRGAFKPTDLLRGMMRGRERCGPHFFLDGVRVSNFIDQINVADLQGVEYYPSAVGAPLEFLSTQGNCAIFAVWTRRGGVPVDVDASGG
jgi:hypothetical protein